MLRFSILGIMFSYLFHITDSIFYGLVSLIKHFLVLFLLTFSFLYLPRVFFLHPPHPLSSLSLFLDLCLSPAQRKS